VGLIDVTPTLLELAGVDVPAFHEGHALTEWVRGEGEDESDAPVFMESGYDVERPQQVVRDGKWKLIRVTSPGDRASMAGVELELYDLDEDPGELDNISNGHPDVVERLTKVLDTWLSSGLRMKQGETIDLEALDPQAVEMLRDLGYVE
jgi:arylsulfatase A-like enzyme